MTLRRFLPLLTVAAVACLLGSAEAAERADRIRRKIAAVERRLTAIETELPGAPATGRESLLQEKERLTVRLQNLKVQLAVLDPADAEAIHDVGMVEQVSVTATTTELPTRIAPVPTQVVTREQIEAVSTDNIEQILSLVPGVTLQRNTPFTMGATTLSFQGAESDHVAILLDGRPFSGGIDGVVDMRDIPAGDIERIEVVRGPGSALYGSAAMAGVINIITRGGGERTSVEATIGGGTFDRQFGRVSVGGAAGPVRYYVFGQTNTYKPEEQWGDFSSQLAEDDEQTRNNGFVSLDVPLETQKFHVGISYLTEQNPGSESSDPAFDASWTKDIGSTSNLTILGSRYSYSRENDFAGLEEDRDYDDLRAEARWKVFAFGSPVWKNHVLMAGYKVRSEHLDSPVVIESGVPGLVATPIDETVGQGTLYAQDEIFFNDRWSFVAGAGWDDHELYGSETSPRASVAWNPHRRFRASLTWGEGFKAPNLIELYDNDINSFGGGFGYEIRGNPNLDPETSDAWNLQFDVSGKWLSVFLHGFRQRYDDLITTMVASDPNGPLVFEYTNVDSARINGINAGVQVDLLGETAAAADQDLSLGLNVQYLETEGSSTVPNEDGNELPFRPDRTFSPQISYAHLRAGSGLSVWANYASAQFTRLDNLEEIEPYWILNFKLTQRFYRGFSLFVEGSNVTDTQQDEEIPVRVISSVSYVMGLSYSFMAAEAQPQPDKEEGQ